MDKTFKTKLIDLVLNDDDVLFHRCLVGQVEGDKAADTCLKMIFKMWITIRGFSCTKNIIEMYKQETKKETEIAKSLCSTLST